MTLGKRENALLGDEFRKLAEKRSKLLREGQPKKANVQYDKLHRLLKTRIRALPDKGVSILRGIAEMSGDRDVRLSAAVCLLAVDEHYALQVLEGLKVSGGETAFTAEMVLSEWSKGNMRDFWA